MDVDSEMESFERETQASLDTDPALIADSKRLQERLERQARGLRQAAWGFALNRQNVSAWRALRQAKGVDDLAREVARNIRAMREFCATVRLYAAEPGAHLTDTEKLFMSARNPEYGEGLPGRIGGQITPYEGITGAPRADPDPTIDDLEFDPLLWAELAAAEERSTRRRRRGRRINHLTDTRRRGGTTLGRQDDSV
jgi:hypothetical protein